MSWSECCGCAMAFYAACQWKIRTSQMNDLQLLIYKATSVDETYVLFSVFVVRPT